MNKSFLVFAITTIMIFGTLTTGNASALPNLPDNLPEVSMAPEKVRIIQGENLIAFAKAHYTTLNNPSNYLTGSAYSGVAELYLPSLSSDDVYGCSGALLPSGLHVLTAAHCVTDIEGNLDLDVNDLNALVLFLDSEIIPIKGVTYHDSYKLNEGNYLLGYDIAILELDFAPSQNVSRYNYATDDNQVGNVVHKVGYGISGYLSSGADGDVYRFGDKRDGQNKYDAFGDTMYSALGMTGYVPGGVYQFDGDDGSSRHDAFDFFFGISDRGLGDNEVNSASGDSGGPTFNSNGEITGITSYGITLQYTNKQTSDCTKQFGQPKLDSSCGEFSGDTRVSLYADFIAATIGNSNTDPTPTPTLAQNDSYTTPYDTTLSVNIANGVLSNDSGDNLSASISSLPLKGTLDLLSTGGFEYIPDSGSTGEDAFTYTATGDGGMMEATVTIFVEDAPQEPPVTGSLLTDIDSSLKQKGRFTDLSFTVTIADETGPASNVNVFFDITRTEPDYKQFPFEGFTDSTGSVTFTVKKALAGICYAGTIGNWSDFDPMGVSSSEKCIPE